MIKENSDHRVHIPWRPYLITTAEVLIAFYLATFCVAMYFTHLGQSWVLLGIFLIVLYLFVIGFCVKQIINTFSLATLMLLVPIAPFVALACVISLIPLMQFFNIH